MEYEYEYEVFAIIMEYEYEYEIFAIIMIIHVMTISKRLDLEWTYKVACRI